MKAQSMNVTNVLKPNKRGFAHILTEKVHKYKKRQILINDHKIEHWKVNGTWGSFEEAEMKP